MIPHGGHGGHGHGGHRHGGHRRGFGFFPLAYEIWCDPNDPYYLECLNRFGSEGTDLNSRPPGSMSPVGFDFLQPEDMRAIRQYIGDTQAVTPEAQQIKADFVKWYDALGPIDVFEQSNFDLARNQRNRFNLANATTPEDKSQVEDVMKTGITAEQAQGQFDRRLPDGMLPGPVTPPPPPFLSTPVLIAGAAVASLAIIAGAYGYGRR